MIEDGAAFASFSVMTPIEEAERTMRRWLEAGRPLSMAGISNQLPRTREIRLQSVHELEPWQVVALAHCSSPELEQRFFGWTWGYGPAKASFAMALAGIGTLACIDRRIARKYGLTVTDLSDWGVYLKAVDFIYPDDEDSASSQAYEWFKDLAAERYDTQHEVMLGVPPPQLAFGWT
jgi:hypothetical protein